MTYRVEFHVSGRGRFPFDMLRYDRCFPADGNSAAALADEDSTELRTITLVRLVQSRQHGTPTNGRWASFGWGVAPNVKVTKV